MDFVAPIMTNLIKCKLKDCKENYICVEEFPGLRSLILCNPGSHKYNMGSRLSRWLCKQYSPLNLNNNISPQAASTKPNIKYCSCFH